MDWHSDESPDSTVLRVPFQERRLASTYRVSTECSLELSMAIFSTEGAAAVGSGQVTQNPGTVFQAVRYAAGVLKIFSRDNRRPIVNDLGATSLESSRRFISLAACGRRDGNRFFPVIVPVDLQFFGAVENRIAAGPSQVVPGPFNKGFDLRAGGN
jgi:hypothetical protein